MGKGRSREVLLLGKVKVIYDVVNCADATPPAFPGKIRHGGLLSIGQELVGVHTPPATIVCIIDVLIDCVALLVVQVLGIYRRQVVEDFFNR